MMENERVIQGSVGKESGHVLVWLGWNWIVLVAPQNGVVELSQWPMSMLHLSYGNRGIGYKG